MEEVNLTGQVHMVTGATSGIGEVTARELARMGAQVIVVSRNQQRCENTVNQIQKETGNQKVDYLVADLSLMKEIRRLAEDFKAKYDRLDVLVNNAGGYFWVRQETEEGLEKTFALDHLNYFLLTLLLLDVIRESKPTRIINVASDAHRGGKIYFDDLQLEHGYNGQKAYAQAKLGNVLFTYELDRRLKDEDITVNAMHPGFVSSEFGEKDNSWWFQLIMKFTHLFGRSEEKGAETVIWLASSPEVEGVSGKYFKDKKAITSSAESYNEETARRLWEVSAEIAGLDGQVLEGKSVSRESGLSGKGQLR